VSEEELGAKSMAALSALLQSLLIQLRPPMQDVAHYCTVGSERSHARTQAAATMQLLVLELQSFLRKIQKLSVVYETGYRSQESRQPPGIADEYRN
jgi:hypothetical protein